MTREPRQIEPGTVYHLISRFVDREWFIKREEERRLYLRLLGRALSTSDWRCLSFAIMSNHVHLGMIAGTQALDSWVRRVHAPFADAMNRTYDRIGAMFVRGPKALAVAPSRVGSLIAYIHNNPVRANLVQRASESTWTSHRAYLGAHPRRWLHVGEGLRRAGFDDPFVFDRWVADPSRHDFDVAHDLELTLQSEEDARLVISPRPAEPESIVAATARELGIPLAQLRSRRRSSIEVVGRAAAVHCAERVGLSGAEIARALGITQQAASSIRRRGVENDAVAIIDRVLRRIG